MFRPLRTLRLSSGLPLAATLALASSGLSGCFLWTSADDGATLRTRADTLEARVAELEATEASFRSDVETAHSKMAELEDVLARATELLTRNSADTGAQVEALAARIAAQDGLIDELRHELERLHTEYSEMEHDYEDRMNKLARRAGLDVELDESEIPASADDHFHAGEVAYEAREFSTARALFRAFVTRHGEDARADDAQYFVGQSYLLEDRPATALGELRRVLTSYEDSDRVPYALFAMSEAFWRLHACDEARTSLEAISRAHSRSGVASDARTRLREYRSPPRGYCTEAAAAASD
jgi:TolA-binding protein